MASFSRKPCPKCKSLTSMKHCASKYCKWGACFKCDIFSTVLYFDKNKYFVMED